MALYKALYNLDPPPERLKDSSQVTLVKDRIYMEDITHKVVADWVYLIDTEVRAPSPLFPHHWHRLVRAAWCTSQAGRTHASVDSDDRFST